MFWTLIKCSKAESRAELGKYSPFPKETCFSDRCQLRNRLFSLFGAELRTKMHFSDHIKLIQQFPGLRHGPF